MRSPSEAIKINKMTLYKHFLTDWGNKTPSPLWTHTHTHTSKELPLQTRGTCGLYKFWGCRLYHSGLSFMVSADLRTAPETSSSFICYILYKLLLPGEVGGVIPRDIWALLTPAIFNTVRMTESRNPGSLSPHRCPPRAGGDREFWDAWQQSQLDHDFLWAGVKDQQS